MQFYFGLVFYYDMPVSLMHIDNWSSAYKDEKSKQLILTRLRDNVKFKIHFGFLQKVTELNEANFPGTV